MKIKILIAIATLVAVSVTAFAQDGAVGAEPQSDQKVEVSREYIPEIGRMPKLFLDPNMTDTVALRPDFDYVISPNAWATGFGVTAINPVKVSASRYNPQHPFYLKMGGGAPGQTLFDLYVASTGKGRSHIGAYVNHYGQYSKIRNDLGFNAKALKTTNAIGLFGQVGLGKRMSLDGGVDFDYNIWSRYGQSVSRHSTAVIEPIKSHVQSHATPRARLVIGNDFTDLSYLNLRLGVEGYHTQDRESNTESGIDAFVEMGKMFSVHKIGLTAGFRGAFGAEAIDGYYDRIFTLAPRYGIVTEGFRFELGADFSYNSNAFVNSKLYVLPQAKVTVNTISWITPFISLDSRIVNNGYRSLISHNPYLTYNTPGFFEVNKRTVVTSDTREYDLRVGGAGKIGAHLMYRVFVGGSLYKDPVFFGTGYYMHNPNNGVTIIHDKRMTLITGGAEVEGRVSNSFMAGLSAHFYNYSLRNLDYASGMPSYDATLLLRYNHNKKLFVTATAKLVGNRRFLEYSYMLNNDPIPVVELVEDYTKESAALDLGIEVEYRLRRGLGIFLQGNNVAGSKLYQFNHYPDQGISVNGGIKLVF